MLLLTTTSSLVQVVTSAIADIRVHASWVDLNAGAVTPTGDNTAAITSATTTQVVGSPAAATQRNVRTLNIRNAHASTSCDVTVQHTDGTDAVSLIKVTLLAGESLVLNQNGDWSHYNTSGALYPTGPIPTGTGFRHVTAGVEDAATKLVDTADINADQVTYAKIQNVSATSRILGRATAGAGDIEELTGAQVQTIIGTGRFVGFQVLTAGTTYTPSATVTSQVVEGWAGGGGGGGVSISTAGQITVGSGGGSGGYFRRRYAIVAGVGTGTYAIGAAGAAGANTGAVAGNGGNTTFTDGTTLCTANGGAGAPAMLASGTTAVWQVGGAGGVISTNGQVNQGGQPGEPSNRVVNTGAANQAISGSGGTSSLNGAGIGRVTSGAGNNAVANSGSGGGGALSLNAAAAAVGGTGGGGIIIVWEFA